MNSTIVNRTTDILSTVAMEHRVQNRKSNSGTVITSTETDVSSEMISPQYINLPRLPDSLPKVELVSDSLPSDLLDQHVVELASTNDIVSSGNGAQYYDDDLLPNDLTEEDKRLAAALVAVQLVQQQKHQNSLLSSELLNSKAIPPLSPFISNNIEKPGVAAMVSSCIQALEVNCTQDTSGNLLEQQQEERLKVFSATPAQLPDSDFKISKGLKVENDEEESLEDAESDYEIDNALKPSRRSLPHKKRIPRKLKTQSQKNIHSKCYKCQKCGDSFSNQSSFFNHRSQHTLPSKRSNLYSCEICSSQFSNQITFFEHLKSHYEPKSTIESIIPPEINHFNQTNEVPVVIETFSLKEECEQDRKMNENNFSCEEWGKIFKRQKPYENHKATAHSSIEEFSEPEDMMEGIRHVVNIQTSADDDSEEKMRNWRFPDDISSDLSPTKNFTPTDDFEETTGTDGEEKGKKKKNKATKCPHCNRVFIHRNSLMYHIRSHSGRRPHQCEVCGKGFFAANALRVHMRMHSGDKPYECEECGRRFRQWGDLKYHVTSLHSTQKQYQCEFCGKDFARKYSLIVHRRIHTGEKNYACEFCRKTFRASSYLVNHRRIHTGEKPYTCDVCEKPFRVKSDMKRHRNTHNKERGNAQQRLNEETVKSETDVETILPDSGTPLNLNMRNDSADSLTYSRDTLDRDPNILYVWLPTGGDSILSDE